MQQQNLFTQMFHKNAWDGDNSAMLQQESKLFPYFGLFHYFLLYETGIGHGDYNSLAGKAAIHFNNAYLLNVQLHQFENASTTNNESKINIAQILINPEPTVEKLLTRQPAPADNTKEALLFEPLYTSDYFASQGIKLSEEVQPGDKLGNQLKSFTEWLKTMKKTTNYKLPENSTIFDKTVVTLAEKSNVETEVITESMAEVFHQQGKINKAKEIYEKLSLLNPSKLAYFADKIEHLKEK